MDDCVRISNEFREARVVRACAEVCKSGRFETGEGTCALICMDQLGDARKNGCRHAAYVHRDLVESVFNCLETED